METQHGHRNPVGIQEIKAALPLWLWKLVVQNSENIVKGAASNMGDFELFSIFLETESHNAVGFCCSVL